jgi:hypothetical protein
MDLQKDTGKTDGLMKFVESQSTKTNPFGDNRVGERAYRRAERICAAIFVLTAHVSDTEPLRPRARSLSLELLERVLAVRSEMRSLNSAHAAELKAVIRELISVSRVLAISGCISFQNSAVMTEALDELSSFLAASQRSSLSETASYSREDFLDVREVGVSNLVQQPRAAVREPSVTTDKSVKDTDYVAPGNFPEKDTNDKGQKKNVHQGRAQAILEVLRVGGELGIRDVASNLPEFSEKMIQRELAELVRKGLVSKSGLKRWSRYSLRG